MVAITTRAGKGSPLTNNELDTNFSNLKTAVEAAETSLTGKLAADGSVTPTASQPMGGFVHTGVGTASSRDHYAVVSQAQDDSYNYAVTVGGTADTITASVSPTPSYVAGLRVKLKATAANTGAATLNLNALGAKSIKRLDGSALAAGDIRSGGIHYFEYDGTNFQLTNVAVVSASDTAPGIIEIATDAEAKAGTDTARAVTPAGMKAAQIVQLTSQSASGTAVDFTGIPSTAKRVTVLFRQLSTNGTSDHIIQLGTSGGVEASGYDGVTSSVAAGGTSLQNWSTGATIRNVTSAGADYYGAMVFTKFDSTNVWVVHGTAADIGEVTMQYGGAKSLAAALDRVRVTTTGGVNTFDSGTINVVYE